MMKKLVAFSAVLLFSLNSGAAGIYGVGYELEYSEKKCSKEYPLLVTIKNRTLKDIKSVSFDVEAIVDGYSTPVFKSRFESDKIIKKFDSYSACYSIHRNDYPGINSDIEVDRKMDPMSLFSKYGYNTAQMIIAQRNSQYLRLDPKYKGEDLIFSVVQSWESN